MTPFQEPKASARSKSLADDLTNGLIDLDLPLPLPMPLAISAITGPFLGLLVSGRMLAQGLTQLGISSEEVFRGDRLPTLPALTDQAAANQQ